MKDRQMQKQFLLISVMSVLVIFSSGCSTSSGGEDTVMLYKVINPEPEWIRNGEPLEFEGELWYPRDMIDVLTDLEVLPLGEYRDVAFYLQKIDVRPFDRLYTKFGKNKYRVFETTSKNDSSHKAF